ncbi:hypothetical protein PH30N_02296 [Cutibacterium modestum 30N]|nr:hypothetical protein HMPREF9622_00544 [Cutibacterium modestum HL037PA3]MCP2374907.1 hypothetical protein [Cutibacterium modestum 28N]MCP2377332.1 hypothetical protein [Cutibacterium modestum 31N]MCP2379914.1 hypothetical protein [Cutibacterium modestum 30N]
MGTTTRVPTPVPLRVSLSYSVRAVSSASSASENRFGTVDNAFLSVHTVLHEWHRGKWVLVVLASSIKVIHQ